MGIVFILVRKIMGVTVEILKRVISNFENVPKERRFDLKCNENKNKMLYSLNQS